MNKKDKELFSKFKKGDLDLKAQEIFSDELWVNLISMDCSVIAKINQSILTKEMIFTAILKNPASAKYLEGKDNSLLNEIVEKNPLTLRFLEDFVPEEKIAEKILEDNIGFLYHCPESLHTVENFKKLIEKKTLSIPERALLSKKDISFKRKLLKSCDKSMIYRN